MEYYLLCTARFRSAFRNTFHRASVGPWGRLEFRDQEPEAQSKDIRSLGDCRSQAQTRDFSTARVGGGMASPPASRGRRPPGGAATRGLRWPGPARKRPQQTERGTPPTPPLTWAMPAPISPPPITVTCLTMIFFAEAEAVDEEDTERTSCRVTKAMLQTQRRRQR